MRAVFLGSDGWSVPSLRSLIASSHEVAGVVTREARPAGRGRRPKPTEVARAAREAGLVPEEVATVRSGPGLEALRASRPDVLVVVAYGEILPAEVLAVPRLAPVNLHFSLLPALRGADPVRRAIFAGHETTGVTTIRMDEGMDTGPILFQESEPILPGDDCGSLGDRLAESGARLLVRTLDGLEEGTVGERSQVEEEASTAPRFRAEEEWIDWEGDAAVEARRIRALSPSPGARTRFRGKVLKVLAARPVDRSGRSGMLVEAGKRGVMVAAGRGAVELVEVVPEGKRRMTAVEWARGQRLGDSESFG